MTFIRYIDNDKQNQIILKKAIQTITQEDPFQISEAVICIAGSLMVIGKQA
jgi:sRNA-binding regulator protein Hfq